MFVPLNVAFICADCSCIFDPMSHKDCPVYASRMHTKLDQVLVPVEVMPRMIYDETHARPSDGCCSKITGASNEEAL